MSDSYAVVRAGEADAGVLSQVIAEAFFDLPASHWLIADPDARAKVYPPYFRIYVEHALAAGEVYTTQDRAAVALWLSVADQPPDPPPGYLERLAAVTGPWLDRFLAFDEALERRHPPGPPHQHLALIAVHPDRQGAGIGTAMLAAHHALLDEKGTPAYLEAASPRTRDIYLRVGYNDLGPPIEFPDGPAMYPMWRPPAPGPAPGPAPAPDPTTRVRGPSAVSR